MYEIEIVPCSKNGWFTPAEARGYYGRYSRDGITWHWWGDGTGASNHDNIVRYLNNKGAAGQAPTVNYVLSDNKITMCVNPDNVAWASGNGNAVSVSVELQPTLGDEGYKKAGWLAWQLEQRYGKTLTFWPHKYWMQTACPGTISLDRIRQEANKWATGGYNPAPTPPPTPPASAKLTWSKFAQVQTFVTNKQPTKLWNFNQTSWGGFGNGVKDFNKGEKIDIYGQCINETLGAVYYVTQYSYEKGITNGFNKQDLDAFVPTPPSPDPQPTPPVDPAPQPTPPNEPEWVTNLRDIDETKYWARVDTQLIDITTGNPTGTKSFKKDEEFVASALTIAGGVEYRITEYSFQKKIFNGVKLTDLTLTPPGEPNVPPVPDDPDLVKKSVIIAFLEGIVKLIVDFINKLKG